MAETKEYDSQAMRDLRAQIEKLETASILPHPTPEVGRPVVWHKGGETEIEIAAIVSQQNAPGQVTLTVFEPNAQPKTVTGVFYEKYPLPEDQRRAAWKRAGTWGYCGGDKATQLHLELHRSQLTKRINDLKEDLRRELEREMRNEQALKAPKESAKGKGALAGASA
jgi:hypothetical protein